MKISIFLMLCTVPICILKAQVGINTTDPLVSLHIKNNLLDKSIPDRFIIPKIEGNQLKQMDHLYNNEQDGVMVYVNYPLTEELSSKTVHVTEEGYYYYDSTLEQWVKLDEYVNELALKTIVKIERSIHPQIIYDSGTPISWSTLEGILNKDIRIAPNNPTVIELQAGKTYKLTGMIGLSDQSSETYMRTLFEAAEPLHDEAEIYFSSIGVVESPSLNTHTGAGSHPVAVVYSGNSGVKIRLVARGPEDGRRTFIAGKPTEVKEGTYIIIEEI